jgi:rod shape determining protein RodA
MMATGLATVYSATYDANNRLLAQALNMAVGLCVMWSWRSCRRRS